MGQTTGQRSAELLGARLEIADAAGGWFLGAAAVGDAGLGLVFYQQHPGVAESSAVIAHSTQYLEYPDRLQVFAQARR